MICWETSIKRELFRSMCIAQQVLLLRIFLFTSYHRGSTHILFVFCGGCLRWWMGENREQVCFQLFINANWITWFECENSFFPLVFVKRIFAYAHEFSGVITKWVNRKQALLLSNTFWGLDFHSKVIISIIFPTIPNWFWDEQYEYFMYAASQ